MRVCEAFANMISQAFASFCTFSQIRLHSVLAFRKVSQFTVSQSFERIRKVLQIDFRECENHGFRKVFQWALCSCRPTAVQGMSLRKVSYEVFVFSVFS